MREVSALWVARVTSAIGHLVAHTVEAGDVRADAKETDLQKLIRTSSRPANDAIGTVRTDVRKALDGVRAEAKGFGKKQGRLIDTILGKVDKYNASEFKRVIGIDAKQLGSTTSHLLDDFRAENVDLIQSIPETLLDQVGETLEKLWDTGARVESVSDALQKRFDVTESKGDLIARDQTLKLNGQLASARQQAAGITKYVWVTSHDERVRGNPSGLYPNPTKTGRVIADHFHLDGQTFTYGEPPITNEATGDRNEPGQDFQCRCTASPVLDFLEPGDE